MGLDLGVEHVLDPGPVDSRPRVDDVRADVVRGDEGADGAVAGAEEVAELVVVEAPAAAGAELVAVGDEELVLVAVVRLVRDPREPAWIPNLRPDFSVRVIEQFGPYSFAVLRELDESNRFVQNSADSTSI